MPNELAENTKKTVLLIEDDVFIRDILYQDIAKSGIKVEVAENGKQAMEKLDQLKSELSLILLDLILPDKNGYEILQAIREDAILKKVPILVLSNLGQKEEIDKAMALGAAAYMIKAQSDTDDILAKMKDFLK